MSAEHNYDTMQLLSGVLIALSILLLYCGLFRRRHRNCEHNVKQQVGQKEGFTNQQIFGQGITFNDRGLNDLENYTPTKFKGKANDTVNMKWEGFGSEGYAGNMRSGGYTVHDQTSHEDKLYGRSGELGADILTPMRSMSSNPFDSDSSTSMIQMRNVDRHGMVF